MENDAGKGKLKHSHESTGVAKRKKKKWTKGKSKLLSRIRQSQHQEGIKPIISGDKRAKATFQGKWIRSVSHISFYFYFLYIFFVYLLVLPQQTFGAISFHCLAIDLVGSSHPHAYYVLINLMHTGCHFM